MGGIDITERDHDVQLDEARARRAHKLEVIGTLAQGLAHEINNPLTGVLNLAELIELDIVTGNGAKDAAVRIKALCERMSATIRNLLAFSSSDAVPLPLSLEEVVGTAIELASPRLKREGVACAYHVAEDVRAVKGRASDLQEAVLILLVNAADAVLLVSPERKQLDVYVEPATGLRDGIAILVCDRGAGIRDDVVERIFDPFFTTRPTEEHAGLGLWVARRIAQDHGGTLTLERREGYATAFRLELPPATHVEAR